MIRYCYIFLWRGGRMIYDVAHLGCFRLSRVGFSRAECVEALDACNDVEEAALHYLCKRK